MSSRSALGQLHDQVHALLRSRAAPALEPFLADWPQPVRRPRDEVQACPRARAGDDASMPLPVLRHLHAIARGDDPVAGGVIETLCGHAHRLDWRQTYSAPEAGADFLQNYGYAELLGPGAPLPADRIACGFLLLGPRTLYPRHRHEAEEIYLPLCGTARWQQGGGDWRERPPGSVIHHGRNEPHAMHTGVRPLLALYLWRSENLNQKASMVQECST